jgi:hypothetical protein
MSSTTRKLCRSGAQPCEPVNIKEALDCVGHHSARPLREIAERIGRTENTLGKECSRYDEEHFPPLRLVVPLTIASENDALITYLARAVGGVFLRIEYEIGRGLDQERVAHAVALFGELLHRSGDALEDGTITQEEADEVQHAGDDVITAIASWSCYLRSRVAFTSVRRPA